MRSIWYKSGVYHSVYMRRVELVSTRVRCPIRSDVLLGVQHRYMYQAKTISRTLLFIMSANTNYYHVIDASHTMPITRINRGPKLLKLIG